MVMVSSGEMTHTKGSAAAVSANAATLWTMVDERQEPVTNRKSPDMKKWTVSRTNKHRQENAATYAQASEFSKAPVRRSRRKRR